MVSRGHLLCSVIWDHSRLQICLAYPITVRKVLPIKAGDIKATATRAGDAEMLDMRDVNRCRDLLQISLGGQRYELEVSRETLRRVGSYEA